MSEDLYGSGPYLDEGFDFEVATDGDLRINSGLSELEKDLSFQMVISLSPLIGMRPTKNFEVKLRDRATRVALADERIDSVEKDDVIVREVTESGEQNVEYELVLPVVVSGEYQELVFGI